MVFSSGIKPIKIAEFATRKTINKITQNIRILMASEYEKYLIFQARFLAHKFA